MTRMVLVSHLDAAGAVVPVRAGQALMAGTDDALEVVSMWSERRSRCVPKLRASYLLTSITDGGVFELPAGKATRHNEVLQAEVAVRAKGEGVGGMVTVLVAQQAAKAEVIILALGATHKVALIYLCISY